MSEAVVIMRHPGEAHASRSGTVLIIDDEAAIRESLETLLELEGYAVESASSGEEGLARLGDGSFDLVLLDLALPDRNGIDLLAEIHAHDPHLSVIMITAYGTVENAVRAMQAGASNFVQKPWDNEKLLADVRTAVARHRAEEENVQLKRALKQRYNFENIVGKSEPMLKIFDLVAQVAASRSTVLLQGESGTGKELIAKAIHLHSPRRDRPFVPVNTGSMPPDLLESTLFGHVKGAFTSAIASKKGLFEIADRGTLFLVEFFLNKYSEENERPVRRITTEALRPLLAYSWPGNVRELENVIERAVVLSSGLEIGPELLPDQIAGRGTTFPLLEHRGDASLFDIMEDCERHIIVDMLEKCNWNQTEASERFHVPLSTLNQKIKRLSIEIKRKGRE